jgi:hypothetical protein
MSPLPQVRTFLTSALVAAFTALPLTAQENYEIQVYASPTVPKGVTIYELHSNFTRKGRDFVTSLGELPTQGAWHETVEITHGFTDWTELGFYWFMAVPDHRGFQWVGTHLRPRFTVPTTWGLPVGISISQEFGYTRKEFSADTWGYELRPIIDKEMGRWYVAFNPVLEKSWRGPTAAEPFEFAPNLNVGFDATSKINVAVEYYGSTGSIKRLDPIADQQHMIYGVFNVDFGPKWEFNVGYGTALTAAGDKSIVKLILGRRVGLERSK